MAAPPAVSIDPRMPAYVTPQKLQSLERMSVSTRRINDGRVMCSENATSPCVPCHAKRQAPTLTTPTRVLPSAVKFHSAEKKDCTHAL